MRARRRRRPATVGVLVATGLLVAGVPGAFATDGPAPSIVGAKGPVTLPMYGDGHSAYRMPSSIAWSLDNRFDFEMFLFTYRASLSNNLNDLKISGGGPGGSFGLVLAPDREWGSDEVDPDHDLWTFHFGIYPEYGGISSRLTRVRYSTFPGPVGTKSGAMFVTNAYTVAYAPTNWLGLGLSFHVMPALIKSRNPIGGSGGGGNQSLVLNGSPQINGVSLPGNPTYADFLDLFDTGGSSDPSLIVRTEQMTVQFTAVGSITIRPTEFFAAGFSYRPRSWAPFPFEGEAEVNAENTFNIALGGISPLIRDLFLSTLPNGGTAGFRSDYDIETEGIHVPRQIRLSLAAWPLEGLVVGAEVSWTEWHRAFNTINVKLKNGSNEDFNFVIGSNSLEVGGSSRWRNTWHFSGYAAFSPVKDLTIRAGVRYGRSPFNPRTIGNSANPAIVTTTLTLGGGYWIQRDVELSLLVEWALPKTERAGSNVSGITARNSLYKGTQLTTHFGVSVLF